MSDWLSVLASLTEQRVACALAVLVQTRGSTPREVGARMIVTGSDCLGSIGGGALEYGVIEHCRHMLRSGGVRKPMRSIQTWQLGPDAGQCCGGVCTLYLETLPPFDHPWIGCLMDSRDKQHCVLATSLDEDATAAGYGKMVISESRVDGCFAADQDLVVHYARTLLGSPAGTGTDLPVVYRSPGDKSPACLLERYGPDDFRLMLFGAGHVGKAVVGVMRELPCRIAWVDSRADMFPASVPQYVEKVVSEAYDQIVASAQPATYFLVMTHSHPLDLVLCEHILSRRDYRYLGLIGSGTKRKRFEKRLMQKGFSQDDIERLTCPIGIPGIAGKEPGAIAVAVAAQILQQRDMT